MSHAFDPNAFPLPSVLVPGDLFPWMQRPSTDRPQFASVAGRYTVLCFFGSLADPAGRAALAAAAAHRQLFDDARHWFFGVSLDPEDERQGRFAAAAPGLRALWDFDAALSRKCGLAQEGRASFTRAWIVVDPTLHVLATFAFHAVDDDHRRVFAFLASLPSPDKFGGFEIPAPVLVLPNLLEPQLCRRLIQCYEDNGGVETGVYVGGTNQMDAAFKRRRDVSLIDADLIESLRQRVFRRVAPEIRKLFFLEITRMERYMVGCYASEDGGHFGPHRDIGTTHTAHRRFALSVNLNDDFEGGGVRFPEYNARAIKAPAGWAVVFPAAILHAVARVTSGRRYAFLPFLYDEAGEAIRQRAGFISGETAQVA